LGTGVVIGLLLAIFFAISEAPSTLSTSGLPLETQEPPISENPFLSNSVGDLSQTRAHFISQLKEQNFDPDPTALLPQLPEGMKAKVSQGEARFNLTFRKLDKVEPSEYSELILLAEEILQIRERHQGAQWWETIDARWQLATLHSWQNLSALAKGNLMNSRNLLRGVESHYSKGQYDHALDLGQQALALGESALGHTHPYVSRILNNLAVLYREQGKYDEALAYHERALTSKEIALGPAHPSMATTLGNLAGLYDELGQVKVALLLYKRSLAISQAALGPTHPDVGDALNGLGIFHWEQGQYVAALPFLEDALAIRQVALGPTHPDVAYTLDNLAKLYMAQGQYAAAVPLMHRALGILEATLPPRHPELAITLNNLAELHRAQGQLVAAIPLYQRALRILEVALPPSHPDVATILDNLAGLYKEQGQNGEALQLQQRSLAIREASLSPTHPDLATGLNNLGTLYAEQGQNTLALSLYQRALRILEVALPTHPTLATNLNNQARLYAAEGQYAVALPLHQRALAIQEAVLPPTHPELAISLSYLAALYVAKRQDAEALPRFLSAAQVEWQHLTENFAFLSLHQKQQWLKKQWGSHQEGLSHIFQTALPEGPAVGWKMVLLQKQILFETTRQENGAMMAALADAKPEWKTRWEAFQTLRRQRSNLTFKARRAAKMLRPLSAAKITPSVDLKSLAKQIEQEDQALRQTNRAYAEQARLQEITLDDVRAALNPGQAVVEYVRYRPYDFTTRKAGPPHYGAFVLVGGNDKVAALDLGAAEGVEGIDTAIQTLRAAMVKGFINNKTLSPKWGMNPKAHQLEASENTIAQASVTLRQKIWDPLEKSLQGVTRIYVAPVGLLSLVPFEMLALKQRQAGGWRYLVEDRELVYLNTSRDLARLALRGPVGSDAPRRAVLISNPNAFASPKEVAQVVAGLPSPPRVSRVEGDRSTGTLGSTTAVQLPCATLSRDWGDLGGSVDTFTTDVSKLLDKHKWKVTTLEHSDAVEEHVLQLQSPRLLQFTTHGVFIDCQKSKASQGWNNPLLRSVLILTGAVNKWDPQQMTFYHENEKILSATEAEQVPDIKKTGKQITLADGLLTAYDVTGMNLQGTELVNLTACETGLGDVTPDGVIGLRHAFLLAGARSLTMSMWEVPTHEISEQIKEFYDCWLEPKKDACWPDETSKEEKPSRYQAFRAAQLAALKRARKNMHGVGHPFYWAGTVYVGDPGDLPALPLDNPKMERAQTPGG